MKVLVVDDQKLNLLLAQEHIKNTGLNCDVLLCNNPEDVLGIMNSNSIDIVLLDIVMPVMSGVEIVEKIRSIEDFKEVQVIMFTSLTDRESFKKCFDLGADDYLFKPIDPIEFNARLNAAVKTRTNSILLKEMFDRVKKQNLQLQEVNQMLKDTQFHMIQKEKMASIGELAAGVAHEINNPIGYVGSNLETLRSYASKIKSVVNTYRKVVKGINIDFIDKQALSLGLNEILETERRSKIDFLVQDLDSLINDSNDGIDRVAKIVQSLRSFARTGLEDEMNLNDLNKIIEEALLIVRNESKYTLDVETLNSEIPVTLCNKGQIGQVLVNLLINSIQAIKSQNREDRGKITISTYTEGNYVCCKIKDDGPGIDKAVLGKIFDPFFTTKDVGMGTGLGLSISYDIITKKHNGELIVESKPGDGAVFIIKIPLSKNA